MKNNMDAIELKKEANSVNIDITTKLLVDKQLLSLGQKKKRNRFLCIYHSDKNPDLGVWSKGNIVKCFVCNTSAKGAELYADALVAKKFSNENVSLLLDCDMEKLRMSSSPKDKETLKLIKEIKKEQHLSIWEGAANICYADSRITYDEFKRHLDEIDRARKTNNVPFLYYAKSSRDGKSRFGSFFHESTGNDNNYELNNFEDVSNYILDNYDFSSIASRNELHFVYTMFLESIQEVRGYKLTTHDYNHLENVREMNEEYMNFYGYISMPKNNEVNNVIDKTIEKLRNANMSIDVLKKVPGFIYDKQTNKYNIFKPPFGEDFFFIPILDVYSNIKRLQIKAYGSTRYLWFATPDAGNCKSPVTVRYPFNKSYKDFENGGLLPNEYLKSLFSKIDVDLDDDTHVIGITEGDFKSISQANEFNIPIMAVQGLSACPNFLQSMFGFMQILKSIRKEKIIFLIGLDADTKVKPNLAQYSRLLSRVLRNCELRENGIKSYYVTWNLSAGKGFDDVVLANRKDSIRLVDSDEYETKDSLIKEFVALRKGIHPSQLTESDLKPLYEQLEKKDVEVLTNDVTKLSLLNSISESKFGRTLNELDSNEMYEMKKYTQLNNSKLESELKNINDKTNI